MLIAATNNITDEQVAIKLVHNCSQFSHLIIYIYIYI